MVILRYKKVGPGRILYKKIIYIQFIIKIENIRFSVLLVHLVVSLHHD